MQAESPSAANTVRISTFSGFKIFVSEKPVDHTPLGGSRGEALLLMLAMNANRPVSRTDMAAVIWNGTPPGTWQASMRNTLTLVRRVVGELPGAELVSAGESRTLRVAGPLVVDILELESHYRDALAANAAADARAVLSAARAALASTADPLIPGADSDWMESLRVRVRTARAGLLRLGAVAALETGDPQTAEQLSTELLDLTPLNEVAHQLLMRSMEALGNRAGALDHYEGLRRRLRTELGITPSRESEELFLDLLRHDEAGVWRTARRHRPFASGRLVMQQRSGPLVGRGTALDLFEDRLQRAMDGNPQVVGVTGPPGIGKTRFAGAVSELADQRGLTVLYGRADNRIPVPYGPVVEGLNSYLALLRPAEVVALAGRHLEVLARLVPAIGAVSEAAPATGNVHLDRLHATQALVHLTFAVAADHGLLLVLDDLQWAGDNVSNFINALLAHPDQGRVIVLATHRNDAGLATDLVGRPSQLARIALTPLSLNDVNDLLDDRLTDQSRQREAIAEMLWKTSKGNPFLVKVLLSTSKAVAHDDPNRTAWEQILQTQISDLPSTDRELINVAAISGEEFDPRMVLRAAAIGTEGGKHAFEAAGDAGLVSESLTHPGWLAFSHAMIRDNVLAQLPRSEQAALHTQIADALEQEVDLAGTKESAHGALAYHLSSASQPGDWRRAVTYAVPVMGAALVAGEFDDVVALGLRTLALLQDAKDPDERSRWNLEILMGAAWRAIGDNRAHPTLQSVVEETRAAGDHVLMADAALALVDRATGTAEAYVDPELIPLYEEVLEHLDEDDLARRARVLGHLATSYAWISDGAKAAALGQEALQISQAINDPITTISVLSATRQGMAGSARVADMEKAEHLLETAARDADDPVARFRVGIWRYETLVQQGHGADLETWLARAESELPLLRDVRSQHQHLYSLASCALIRGEVNRADELVEEAATIGRSSPAAVPMVEAIRISQLMSVRFEQGRLGELRNEMVAMASASGIPEWMGTVAFYDGELGRVDDAREELALFFSGFDQNGPTMAAPIGLAAQMANAIRLVGDRERARSLYDVLLPYRGLGGYFSCFSGPFDHWLGVLAGTYGDKELATEHLTSGLEFSTRLGAPLWIARSTGELEAL